MSLQSFCSGTSTFSNDTLMHTINEARIREMKAVFQTIQIVICAIGVGGNILNLLTLRSRTLQTVPFMYIRSIAIFDLIGLSFIALHFALEQVPNASYEQMFYSTYFEETIINTFLVASCYCALMLTVERYVLITQPHMRRPINPRRMARLRIILVLFFCFLLHSPMTAQNRLKIVDGKWRKGNNVEFLCVEPIFSLFNYYKMSREFIRFICIIAMAILNAVIARKLQIAKRKRRRMILRPKANSLSVKLPSNADTNSQELCYQGGSKRETNSLMRSFTEKKLTALMIAITFIFMIGNLPQTFVMVLQNESCESDFSFQVLRNVANALEVLNHCLNFYVFCMASSEYTRAFLLNCLCIRRLFTDVPACARFIYSRKASSCLTSRHNSMRFSPVLLSDDDMKDAPNEINVEKDWKESDQK
ncbi:putative G-protein coupled receptor [Toxocara canis]|uniref:Putative G-protein coupled receptor n=1 Tax=Toxocara canis TaxID=6265 RepID=A0A0B2VWL6_TOXCA|nr:putative G-protein coupled receptor [Toxocara canis]